MNRDRLTIVLLTIWAVLFAHTVKAATLSEFMGVYDWESLEWAGAIALLGGSLRTIFSLQSDRRIVREIAREAAWDALKALAAGLLAFIALEAIRAAGFPVPSEVKFGAILAAGIMRMSAVDWMRDAAFEWLDARKKQFVGKDPKDTP